ncbi:MAG: class I SAM-dependent methyltransferase [Deltaproteobacteria bacterium]|nr:class I SAM-dependent methyltransferase [Deltaproteobacteria bacterium]
MSVLGVLRRKRRWINDRLTQAGQAHTFSLPNFLLHRLTLQFIAEYSSGRCLDAGSGRSPWKQELVKRGFEVISIDVEDRAGEVDIVTDIQDMPEIEDSSMGTVLCTQVLEHVPRPWEAAGEVSRVLQVGGVLIGSVPHLSMLHEEPHDYYRYTRYGLTALFEAKGLKILQMRECGGLLSFLGHTLSFILLCPFAGVPGLWQLAHGANYLFLVRALAFLDRFLGASRVFPCNYVFVAEKQSLETSPDTGVET